MELLQFSCQWIKNKKMCVRWKEVKESLGLRFLYPEFPLFLRQFLSDTSSVHLPVLLHLSSSHSSLPPPALPTPCNYQGWCAAFVFLSLHNFLPFSLTSCRIHQCRCKTSSRKKKKKRLYGKEHLNPLCSSLSTIFTILTSCDITASPF